MLLSPLTHAPAGGGGGRALALTLTLTLTPPASPPFSSSSSFPPSPSKHSHNHSRSKRHPHPRSANIFAACYALQSLLNTTNPPSPPQHTSSPFNPNQTTAHLDAPITFRPPPPATTPRRSNCTRTETPAGGIGKPSRTKRDTRSMRYPHQAQPSKQRQPLLTPLHPIAEQQQSPCTYTPIQSHTYYTHKRGAGRGDPFRTPTQHPHRHHHHPPHKDSDMSMAMEMEMETKTEDNKENHHNHTQQNRLPLCLPIGLQPGQESGDETEALAPDVDLAPDLDRWRT